MHLMNLPDDVLEKILSYVSFDEVSRSRLVCQKFNDISKRVLNHGFLKTKNYHSQCLKRFKAQLPRRESERRNHPLAEHFDILSSVERRLSLLGMTFKEYIENNFCCFIPGKVLDEIYRVLRYVTSEPSPMISLEVLQELRDLSSMATEYFEEKIVPSLKKQQETESKIDQHPCNSNNYLKLSKRRPLISQKKMVLVTAHYLNKLGKKYCKLNSEVAALRTKKRDEDATSKRIANLERIVTETRKELAKAKKKIAENQITITNQGLLIKKFKLKEKKSDKCFAGEEVIRCDLESGSSNCNNSFKTIKRLIDEENYAVCAFKIEPLKTLKRKLESNLEAEVAKKKFKK